VVPMPIGLASVSDVLSVRQYRGRLSRALIRRFASGVAKKATSHPTRQLISVALPVPSFKDGRMDNSRTATRSKFTS